MALIKTTAIVDSISGKLNGTVFAKNKGGAYMRSKSTVSNPRTQAQQAVRSAFGSISQAWRDLSDEERDAWNSQTENYKYTNVFGDLKALSGKALFQQLNGNLLNVSQTILSAPLAPMDVIGGTDFAVPLAIDLGAATPADKFVFELTLAQALEQNQYYVLEATPPLSPGVSNANNQFRQIAVAIVPATATELPSTDFSTPVYDSYVAVFGLPVVGSKIFVRIKPVASNGQAGPYISTSTIVVEV